MELGNFLRDAEQPVIDRFVSVFKDMQGDSSFGLLKQLDDRIRKQKNRLRHKQVREARLKDKLESVSRTIQEAKDAKVNSEGITVLKEWRDEVLNMLDKIDTKTVEDKIVELQKIREKIKRRLPFMNKVLEEFADGAKS